MMFESGTLDGKGRMEEDLLHTVNLGSEMVEAKHVSGKNICWSTLIAKSTYINEQKYSLLTFLRARHIKI